MFPDIFLLNWMNTAWLIPTKNTKKRTTITTTKTTKITKKKVTKKDHIDDKVFEDEEEILQVCEDSFMIQNFSAWLQIFLVKFLSHRPIKQNIRRTDIFHANIKVNYLTVTRLWIKASNENSPPTTLPFKANFSQTFDYFVEPSVKWNLLIVSRPIASIFHLPPQLAFPV